MSKAASQDINMGKGTRISRYQLYMRTRNNIPAPGQQRLQEAEDHQMLRNWRGFPARVPHEPSARHA